ncbi:MAG: tetratricopeptide repeat protein [bacterium]
MKEKINKKLFLFYKICRDNRISLIIFFAAFLIRFIFYINIKDTFLFENPILDAKYYFDWARSIANGDLISSQQGVFLMSPGYPYILAVLFKLLSIKVDYPILFQIFLGSISCVLIFRICLRFVNRFLAVAAGLLLAFYGIAVFYDGMLLKSSLYQFLSILFIFLFLVQVENKKYVLSLFLGLIIGLLIQLRPYAVLLFFLTTAFYVYECRKESLRRLLYNSLFLTAGLLIMVLPVGIRNYIVGNQFVLSTAHGGMNFYTGNNKYSVGPYTPLPFARTDPEYEQQDFLDHAIRLSKKKLSRSEANIFWYKEGLKFISANPVKWLKLMGKKLLIFINNYEPPINIDYYFFNDYYGSLQRIAVISFGLIAPFGIIGLVFYSRKSRKETFLVFYFLIYFFSNIVFFAVSEYRYPIVPVLIIFTVILMSRIADYWKHNNWGKITIISISVFFLLWLCNADIYSKCFKLQTYKAANLANSYFGLGVTYESFNKDNEAVEAYKKSISIMPQDSSIVNLSNKLLEKGKEQEAEKLLLWAIKLRPDSFEAHNNLGNLFYQRGEYKNAFNEFSIAFKLNPYSEAVKNNVKIVSEKLGVLNDRHRK